MVMNSLEQQIISLLSQRRKKSLTRREIADHLGLRGGERKVLTKVLEQLLRSGQLGERKGQYRLAEQQRTLEGTFAQAEQGYGFLRVDTQDQEDLFIPARHVGSAMDGDRVLVQWRVSSRDRRPFGQVLQVLERAHSQLLGTYQRRSGKGLVWPLEQKLPGPVLVGKQSDIEPGTVVEVSLERFATQELPATGKISEILGPAGDPQVDIETVIRSHGLPRTFSPAALAQAETAARPVSREETATRVDLRSLPLVTIDGETARDFDDAVALKKKQDGSFRLWVCIADVAHYVTPGSAVDIDALERGTSVYFPGFCLPMLPEALSNGICSLNPAEDRLVMTAELCIDQHGVTTAAEFYPAVMRSRARLTYTQVAAWLETPDSCPLEPEVQEQLPQMADLAQILTRMRADRGSLDLDVPEVEILLAEDGQPRDLIRIERNQAHRLIEEFMLAANEAVAAFLQKRQWPFLYRIHERPDLLKLQELQQLAAECGVGLVLGKQLHQALQGLLAEVAERPEGRLINQQLLRSLQQACYAPDNQGHFGLAADCYCHFTSPIRRYPDLVVHRVLKQVLAAAPKSASYSHAELETLGRDCSARERRAVQAERDLIDLRCCQLMAGRVGEEFSGTISSVTEFGFFVELDELLIDGLVHIRTLRGDYYHFDPLSRSLTGEHRRRQFRIGMRVQVRVKKVEAWRRRIDFELVE
ncbi:ribonuclease R [Pelobacter seleniigenes]|uniref:ribonuclease R n=1 Tax=Pelobacter seleniigenes TaxID=407188 RepID=UPI00068B77D8|nr:ribonuclease R [Pelobacter seleniigenes]